MLFAGLSRFPSFFRSFSVWPFFFFAAIARSNASPLNCAVCKKQVVNQVPAGLRAPNATGLLSRSPARSRPVVALGTPLRSSTGFGIPLAQPPFSPIRLPTALVT
jgi:hypothetical protein